jgi:tetratricopeptide (TPR) repeat protein
VLNDELHETFGVGLAVRIGINTGEVVTSVGGTLATGDAVNVAARLEQAAQAGEILLGERTRQLAAGALELQPVGPIEAKGKTDALNAYRLVAVHEGAPAFSRRFDAPFVGRERELGHLEQAYERAVRDRACHLFTVLGSAGIGKSRLIQEFLARRGDAGIVRGRCLAYGEGITYFPLVEIVEALAADTFLTELLDGAPDGRQALNRVASALGLADTPPISREETFHAVRRLFETLARRRPLVVVFDDIHWAEPTFLDLIDHVVDWSRDAPLFLLCMARPELLDTRPGWSGGKLNATTTLLEPLSAEEADALIDNLLADSDLSPQLRTRIGATAEGNPLFVEQMLALLADNGVAGELEVPPTIQALLATRLEQLPTVERVAAERAAVVGKEFWTTALVELGGESSALPPLVRKELIRPHQSLLFPTDDAFRFRHLLIRDAAYDGMPKELRAELHERFARWLEQNRSEYDEIVGYHYEQAYRLREELGRVDERGSALAHRAGAMLVRAGSRAYERGDIPAAVNLLSRSTQLRDERDGDRLRSLVELGYALKDAGDLARSAAVFEEAARIGNDTGDRAVAARARIGSLWTASQTGAAVAYTDDVAAQLQVLEELHDDEGLSEGYAALGTFDAWTGHSAAAADAFDRSRLHGARVGNQRLARTTTGMQTMLESWGHLPADEGRRKTQMLLEEHRGPADEAFIRNARALYLSLLGERAAALAEWTRARDLLRDLGMELQLAATAMVLANHELRFGRPAEAEAATRDSLTTLDTFNETGYRSTLLGILAEALYAQGRLDEAAKAAEDQRALAAADDFEPQVRWRILLGRVLAQRGEIEAAETLARDAVAIAAATDWYLFHGDALVALAEVLEQAGRTAEAAQHLADAVELYDRKRALVNRDTTRRKLERLTAS